MSYLGDNAKRRLARVQLPGDYQKCVAVVRDYLDRTGLSAAEFAERTGRGRSSINIFVQGRWQGHHAVKRWDLLAAHLIDFVQRHPIDSPKALPGKLYVTENFRRIREYFVRAADHGEVCLLYGPPGTQKSFVLEYLTIERNLQQKGGAHLVYASEGMQPLPLLRRVGRTVGVMTGWRFTESLVENLLFNFRSLRRPPALVVDEAQHLPIASLEILRELHDRSGCGLVLAGSHNLYEKLLLGRTHLEQLLSRFDHKNPLPGLTEEEAKEIAARELGDGTHRAKLTDLQQRKLIAACTVVDIFARGADGKPATVRYCSIRRLLKYVGQLKRAA